MSTFVETRSYIAPIGPMAGVRRFAAEAIELVQALVSPVKLVAEVETMRALQVRAARLQDSDPTAAAALRRRAAGMCRA